jgi:hypothetical protein
MKLFQLPIFFLLYSLLALTDQAAMADFLHGPPFTPDVPHRGRVSRACLQNNVQHTTCAAIQSSVKRRGTLSLLSLGRCVHVVADEGYCKSNQYLRTVWVQTQDFYNCFAGYACTDIPGQ